MAMANNVSIVFLWDSLIFNQLYSKSEYKFKIIEKQEVSH